MKSLLSLIILLLVKGIPHILEFLTENAQDLPENRSHDPILPPDIDPDPAQVLTSHVSSSTTPLFPRPRQHFDHIDFVDPTISHVLRTFGSSTTLEFPNVVLVQVFPHIFGIFDRKRPGFA